MVSTLGKPVPTQMNPESEATLILVGKAVQSASKAILIFHSFLSLFLGGALQQLLSLATFNIIDLVEPIRKAGNLYEDEIINQNFYNLGYQSNYFIINMGNLYIAMLGIILMLLLTAAT